MHVCLYNNPPLICPSVVATCLSVVYETKEKGRERRCKRQCPSSFWNPQNSVRGGFTFSSVPFLDYFKLCM